jgi:hypothetical protein
MKLWPTVTFLPSVFVWCTMSKKYVTMGTYEHNFRFKKIL